MKSYITTIGLAILATFLVFNSGCQRKDMHYPPDTVENLKVDEYSPVAPATVAQDIPASINPLDRFTEDPALITSPQQPELADYHSTQHIPTKDAAILLSRWDKKQNTSREKETLVDRTEVPLPAFRRITVSREKYFSISFDNDIFSNTDYYYTSGLAFELFHPGLGSLPSAHLLPRAGQGASNAYSISLTQTLFTPIDPDKSDIQRGDRPFASYLILGFSNYSNNTEKNLRLTSRLDLGVIGKAALGGFVQKTVHNIEPVGWQNQISNDVIINYLILMEKGLELNKNVMLIGLLGGQAGSLYTNMNTGGRLRISNTDYFSSPVLSNTHRSSKINYYAMLSVDASLVIHDATLQGGLFSQSNNIYHIPSNDMNRAVLHCSLAAGINFGRFTLEAQHLYLTPEFSTGKSHMWSRIKTTVRL